MKIIRRLAGLFVSKPLQRMRLPAEAFIDTLTCLPRVSLEACELSCRHFQRLIESTDGLALRRIPLLKVVSVRANEECLGMVCNSSHPEGAILFGSLNSALGLVLIRHFERKTVRIRGRN